MASAMVAACGWGIADRVKTTGSGQERRNEPDARTGTGVKDEDARNAGVDTAEVVGREPGASGEGMARPRERVPKKMPRVTTRTAK